MSDLMSGWTEEEQEAEEESARATWRANNRRRELLNSLTAEELYTLIGIVTPTAAEIEAELTRQREAQMLIRQIREGIEP